MRSKANATIQLFKFINSIADDYGREIPQFAPSLSIQANVSTKVNYIQSVIYGERVSNILNINIPRAFIVTEQDQIGVGDKRYKINSLRKFSQHIALECELL